MASKKTKKVVKKTAPKKASRKARKAPTRAKRPVAQKLVPPKRTVKKPKKKLPKIPPARTRAIQEAGLMQVSLDTVGAYIQSGSVSVFINPDNSVDGELRIERDELRGYPTYDVLLDMMQALSAPKHHWIILVFRIEPKDADRKERYKVRYRGGMVITTKPRPWNRKAYAFYTGQRIAQNYEKRNRRRVVGILLRLHWNSKNIRPTSR